MSFGQSPGKRRSVARLSGLRNQGATCYLNSLIQTLFLTRELRDSLFRLDGVELGEVDGSKEARKIPVELRRLFTRLLLLDVDAVSTGALTESFGWTGGEVVQQHDVQELNRILFTALEDSLIGTSGSALIRTLYHGELVNQVHCQECGNCSQRRESFLDIAVPVVNGRDLETALQSLYGEKEFLCGPNQYFCDACNKKVDAFKGAVLSELPQILTVSLLRFHYDWEKGERHKEVGHFAFPDELDMTPYCLGDGGGGGKKVYELMSVVVHRGGAHGGHYFAYIRDMDGLGAWSAPSGGGGGTLVETNDCLDLTKCDSPVDVLVTILAQQRRTSPAAPVTVDQLCRLLQQRTGVSWNKRFKRRHGSLIKFMRDRGDVFCVAGGEVSLAAGAAKATMTALTCAASVVSTASESTRIASGVAAAGKDTKATNTTAACSDNWFSFNDNRATPAEKSVLQDTFAGKESAYMVFYRRKEENGTTASYDRVDVCNAVPENLLCEVAAENFDLDEQRDAYEVCVNTIDVNVHRSADFENRHGVVQRTGNAQERFSVDGRAGYPALVSAVKKLEGDVTGIYVAVPCPSGLHLLQEIPQSATSLPACGLLSDGHVLVLDGSEEFAVGNLLMGEDQKPLLIRCQVPSSGDAADPQEIAERPFSQSTSVSDVISLFCQQHGVQPPPAVTAFNPREKKPLPLSRDAGALSIKNAGLVDGALLCFSDGTRHGDGAIAAAVPHQTVAPPSVVVENWCHYKAADGGSTGDVRNGDALFLLPGLPPPPDCVRLSVFVAAAAGAENGAGVVGWLSSVVTSSLSLGRQALAGAADGGQDNAPPVSSSVDAPSSESEASAVAEAKPAPEDRSAPAHQFLATVDVKRTANVDDLKAALLELPLISNGTSMDPGRLRVRRLQDGRALRIFRQADSICSLKLVSGSDIVCEVRETAETLPASCVVLLARRSQQATRSYGDAEEIVFNTQDGCNATRLRSCLLEHFRLDCAASDIHCAKQLPDQYDWLPILDQAASGKAQKKKGRGGAPRKAVNLRNGPVFLQDGDTVAFKLATEERCDTPKDFRTADDEAGLRRLEEMRDEERRACKQRKHSLGGGDGAKPRRAEVGIQIIVPKYEQAATGTVHLH